jgi:hypothetical protein
MKNNYQNEKSVKEKSTARVMWMILVLFVLFSSVVFRMSEGSGFMQNIFNEKPSETEAYDVAKDFTQSTLRSRAVFAEEPLQCTETGDSMFSIQSYFDTETDNHTRNKTAFTAKVKYNGGGKTNEKNWSLVSLEKQ